jgi:hypothetical protein
MSTSEVRHLFGIKGRVELDSPDGRFFRFSFRGCAWTHGDRVFTAFSFRGFGLDHWSVH